MKRGKRVSVRSWNGDTYTGKIVHGYEGDFYLIKFDIGIERRIHISRIEVAS